MYVDISRSVPLVDMRDQNIGKIPSEPTLIVGGTGSGKSMMAESLAFMLYCNGHKVIFLTDVKNTFESAFSCLEPMERYHIRKNKRYGVPIRAIPTNILHPFTFNIPEKKLPEITFYTIPIKSLGRDELSYISETMQDTSTIKVLMDTISDLQPDEGLSHLIYYAEEKSESMTNYKGKQLRSLEPDAFFTKGAQGSTMKTISNAISLFKPFQTHYMLTPQNCKYNLDLEKEINDQKHYTVLVTKYIPDPKLKLFAIDNFLHELDRVLEQNKARYPLAIIIEEMPYITPDVAEGYTVYLSSDIAKLLKTIRNKGKGNKEIGTAQAYFAINKEVRRSMKETILGSTGSIDEIQAITKALGMRSEDRTTFMELTRGEFLSKSLNNYTEKFKPFLPPHRHAEEGQYFEEEYAKTYPDKMQRYTENISYIKKVQQEIDHEVKEMAQKYNEEIISTITNKEKEKKERQEATIQKHAETTIKKEQKIRQLEIDQAREWNKMYEETGSYQKVADKYNNEHGTKIYSEKIRRAIKKVREIDTK